MEGKAFFQRWIKDGKNRLFLMVAGGILLLLLSWPSGGTRESRDGKEAETEMEKPQADTEQYAARLEERLGELLRQVDGAGEVSVMITLSASARQVLQEDQEAEENVVSESDDGRLRSESADSRRSNTFRDGENSPFVVQEEMPQVEGVAVAAEGASSAVVRREILEAVQALFDLPAHKIKVLKKEK